MQLHVEWAGLNRDALVEALEGIGLEPRVLEEDGDAVIELPCDEGDEERLCAEVLARVESLLGELGVPLVPERGEGRVYLRPPAA